MSTFPTLPTELRHLIFHFAILTQSAPKIHRINPFKNKPKIFISNQPIPTLLHACHDSRSLFLATQPLTFAYGTYILFPTDTIYLASCPGPMILTPDISMYSDGFEACKDLGRNEDLRGKVKILAVNDTFWLRSSSVARSVAVDTWNVVIKGKLSGLEELVVVFDGGEVDGDEEKGGNGGFETIGWYKDGVGGEEWLGQGEVGSRQRKCDDFLRVYLGYFPADKRVRGMRIRYVVASK